MLWPHDCPTSCTKPLDFTHSMAAYRYPCKFHMPQIFSMSLLHPLLMEMVPRVLDLDSDMSPCGPGQAAHPSGLLPSREFPGGLQEPQEVTNSHGSSLNS